MVKLLSRSLALIVIALIYMTIVVFAGSQQVAAAENSTWSVGSLVDVTFEIGGALPEGLSDLCPNERVLVSPAFNLTDMCISRNDTWRMGWSREITASSGKVGDSMNRPNLSVGFGRDSRMYPIWPPITAIMTNTDAAIVTSPFFENRPGLYVVSNFRSKVILGNNSMFGPPGLSYTLGSQRDYAFKWQNGKPLQVKGVGSSQNNKWLAAELYDKGIIIINLETFEAKRISSVNVSSSSSATPYANLAVSNDGRYVAAAGIGFPGTIITVSDGCGDLLLSEVSRGAPLLRPCKESLIKDLSPSLGNVTGATYPSFNHDATELRFLVASSGGKSWQIILRTSEYSGGSGLDYLALGDSYSSGEGDTEKDRLTDKKYYLPFTDIEGGGTVPREVCHVSSRSYPFVLRRMMDISADKMASVACSGAVVSDDYTGDNEGYRGQNERLKALGSEDVIDSYKASALNNFIPGRNQQIEFVRRYQPKAITLTGGGNDAGFGDVVRACAPMKPIAAICDYASTMEGKMRLGRGIANQYVDLIKLYTDLHNSSPTTKIYVLGYPQFVSEGGALPCFPNVTLNIEERVMARAAVVYMNNVIEAAAKTVGVKYIDIENSLGDNILCGGAESYVTGLAMSGKITFDIEALFSLESFHPNAKGHHKMAETIRSALGGTRADEYGYCPDAVETICPDGFIYEPEVPEFFADAMGSDARNYVYSKSADKSVLQKGKDVIAVRLKGLKPNTIVNIWAFSNPTDLGAYSTDGNGALEVDISLPEGLSAGAHTLQVESETFSGELIALWEIFWVIGREGDIDEDGIEDSAQACLFVQDSGLDSDRDGIDDACDSDIGNIDLSSQVPGVARERTVVSMADTRTASPRQGVLYSSVGPIPSLPGEGKADGGLLGSDSSETAVAGETSEGFLPILFSTFLLLLVFSKKAIINYITKE